MSPEEEVTKDRQSVSDQRSISGENTQGVSVHSVWNTLTKSCLKPQVLGLN